MSWKLPSDYKMWIEQNKPRTRTQAASSKLFLSSLQNISLSCGGDWCNGEENIGLEKMELARTSFWRCLIKFKTMLVRKSEFSYRLRFQLDFSILNGLSWATLSDICYGNSMCCWSVTAIVKRINIFTDCCCRANTSTSNPFSCAAYFFLQLGSCKEAVR